MILYKIITRGELKIMSAIKKIMEVTMEKTVELEYSGTGRTVNGLGKKNFSNTATYKCLDGVLSDQFADSGELKNLSGKVGRWLSGAADRGGGRKERTKKN
ncbi:uncharacterized protein LOC123292843 [Chrysoperla carnea]|uniref:uncharacterized protein LOC123292843 n=1 Tax=Chrysoperla carnea TaxID=189513 RepID=UPI001D06E4A8|nr:uncharacterized protein LOC123292843 [Chrysoperla carnea]